MREHPFGELAPGKMKIVILEFRSKYTFFLKWFRKPNHYAHKFRIEILFRTLFSILDISHRKSSKYSFLAWMSTWISRRCRQFYHLARPLGHSAQGWNIPFGNPSLRSLSKHTAQKRRHTSTHTMTKDCWYSLAAGHLDLSVETFVNGIWLDNIAWEQ